MDSIILIVRIEEFPLVLLLFTFVFSHAALARGYRIDRARMTLSPGSCHVGDIFIG